MMNYLYHEQMFYDNEDDVVASSKDNLYSPDEGFVKGTIYKTLYKPYKNYQPGKINVSNEKERLMNAVQMYAFALNDINLYLAVYPKDTDALKVRKEYLDKYNRAKEEYQSKYPAFCLDYDFDVNKSFNISVDNFPWDNGVTFR